MRVKRSTIIDVGVFVTVGLALALTAVFFIGREKSFFERRYTLIAPFKGISGLRMGAVVQLAGINVGYVDGVRFGKAGDQNRIDVILKVSKTYQDHIRKDSVASIQTQGLLGDKFILISSGSIGMPPLADGEIMATEEGGGFGALADTGKKTLEDIRLVAKDFQQTLETVKLDKDDKENIKKFLANLNAISGKIKNGEGTIGALIMDPSLYFDMRALMGHANRNKLLKNLIRATVDEQDKATAMPVKKE